MLKVRMLFSVAPLLPDFDSSFRKERAEELCSQKTYHLHPDWPAEFKRFLDDKVTPSFQLHAVIHLFCPHPDEKQDTCLQFRQFGRKLCSQPTREGTAGEIPRLNQSIGNGQ